MNPNYNFVFHSTQSEYQHIFILLGYCGCFTVGPKHYYFSMNRIEGNKVVAWPYSLDARLKGSVAGQVSAGLHRFSSCVTWPWE